MSIDDLNEEPLEQSEDKISNKYDKLIHDGDKRYKLSGMYKDWFLDYASYVILERAVPHINDGLKPVQRRILHAMKNMDDGRYNKVANIIGFTMQFHPHGDASIGDALVQLGQKDYLIDCQGNWGNILTGDGAAAPRYIEARLSEFAKDVVFNPKTTEWMNSYDGRNQEPVSLPVKFPLLLAQGVEGIAVGLASKIAPHNFNELIDASIAILKGEEFTLYPDFPTGGIIDCCKYNRGIRGGQVRIRSTIIKRDKNTLVITDIPFSKTSGTLIESILKANEKGKIKIRKVDDNTAADVEIVIHLHNDTSPDKTIDALYAFTDCEISFSPNSCIIIDKNPHFIGVDEVLRYNTESTKNLLTRELEIRLSELEGEWHYLSLEKIFFDNKIYKILEHDSKSWEDQLDALLTKMLDYQDLLKRPIVMDDIKKLVEKPVRKISKFDVKIVDEKIAKIESEMEIVKGHLNNIIEYTISYFTRLKSKYGDKYPRKSILANFETIKGTEVVNRNAKLYANKAEGFVGIQLKKDDDAEFICDCSDIDDIIVFLRSGKYIVTKVSEKQFFGKNIIHVGIFNKNKNRTVYNAIYRDGKNGIYYAKRFSIKGITRDKEYDLTKGTPDSAISWFTANNNGEAEVLKVLLRPRPKLKKLYFEFDFSSLSIKNRDAMGNIVSKNPIHKIQLKAKGISTIGGKSIWFEWDTNRINEESRGEFLGEFSEEDRILTICKDGTFYTTNTDTSNRYQGDLLKVEKFDQDKTYTVVYWDGEINCFYLKRFSFPQSDNIVQSFISEAKGSYFVSISDEKYPQIEILFGGRNEKRPSEKIDAEEFIGKKGYKAKGKRITNLEVDKILFIEPLVKEESFSIEELDINSENSSSPQEIELQIDEDISTLDVQDTIEFDIDLTGNNNEPTLF